MAASLTPYAVLLLLQEGCYMIGVRKKRCICDDVKDKGGENIALPLSKCRA